MTVIDASVVVDALVDQTPRGEAALDRLSGGGGHAPELLDLEVVAALRGQRLGGHLSANGARQALRALARLPLVRHRHAHLLPRVWELRDNLTAYDAAYVALAELLHAPLVTADARLTAAPGMRCEVELLD